MLLLLLGDSQLLLFIYNLGWGIWSGLERFGKAGRGKGGLISTSACFLTGGGGGGGALGTDFSTQLSHFPNISLFPKVLNLKSFSNSWGNSYSKFVILDITFHFTNG